MTARNRQHGLQSIFHPHWTPSDDSQLLALRDQGVSLDRIAMALMRQPKAVEQRWHRLRVVPGVREKLRTFGTNSAEYPVENPDDLKQRSEVLAP
jgi:hypothetical protein